MDTPTIATQLRAPLNMAAEVVCAYLFGSQARGEAGPDSDLDIAVLLDTAPPATLVGLRDDLARALEETVRRPVDLIVLNHAEADLIHRVLRDGVLLIDRDKAARIRFEVRARNEYFDLAPVRERYRQARSEHA